MAARFSKDIHSYVFCSGDTARKEPAAQSFSANLLKQLLVTTSTVTLLAIAFVPSTSWAQGASFNGTDSNNGPFSYGLQTFSDSSMLNAATANTLTGGNQIFNNTSTLKASAADAVSGGLQNFKQTSVLNALATNTISGGQQDFDHNSILNASAFHAISGGSQYFRGSSSLNANVADAIGGGTQTFFEYGALNVRAANALNNNNALIFSNQVGGGIGGFLFLNDYDTVVGRITSAAPRSGWIANGGTSNASLIIDNSQLGDSSFSGTIVDGGGTLALVKRGSGTLEFAGSNGYSGGTKIEEGTLRLRGIGSLGAPTGSLIISSGASLQLDGTGQTVGPLSGAGTIFNLNPNPAVLTVNQNTDTVFSGAILSQFDEIDGVNLDVSLTKSGNGTLTLSGHSTYSGATNVTGGTLLVDGTLGPGYWGPIALGSSPVSVASGAALGGAGSIAGDVSVADGGKLLGRAGQTLSMGSLALSSGSVIDVSLGSPSNTRLFNVTSNLTLNGTLNVADAGGFGNGLYRLFDYGGTLSGSGLTIGTTPVGYAASDLTVQTAVANQVNLLVGAVAPGSYNFWNGPQTTPNNTVNGGAGPWTPTGTNWTNANGSTSGAYDPAAMLIFQGTPGTVTVDAGGSALDVKGGMQFFVDGYKVTGDALKLTAPATPIRVGDGTAVGAGMTATIASALTGSGGIDKTDLGTLVLSGVNTYTGGTTISAGTLKLEDSGTLGAPTGTLAIGSAGTLDLGGTNQTIGALSGAGSITSSMSGGQQSSLTVKQASNTSYGGAITDGYSTGTGTGTVWLMKNGAGTLTLTGNSTFAFTTVDGGTLAIANGGKVANETSYVGEASGSNGTVLVTGNGSVWTTDYLYLGYRGAGTLTIADGGRVRAASIDMVRTSTSTGTGTLNLNGTAGARGVLETNGIQKTRDGATVNFDGGILRAMAFNGDLLSHFAVGDVSIKAGGAFIDSNGGSVSISSPLSGVGALTKQGAGSLTLNGANTYAGGTIIETGTLQVIGAGTLGASTGPLIIAGGASLDLGGTQQTVGSLSGAGNITSTIITPSRLTVNQADTTTFSGVISDGFDPIAGGIAPVGLTKQGAGTLILTGTNTYTGDTLVEAGTLTVNGSVAQSTITLAGGMLRGSGTVGGVIVQGQSIVAPGNSIGTLNVAGNITFNSGSIYQVEVNAAGQSDRIVAGGTATINGGSVQVLAGSGNYAPSTQYTILSAAGGRTGAFESVSSNFAFLTPSLSYDANTVYLTMTRNSIDFSAIGGTTNQRSAGAGVESTGWNSSLYNTVLNLSALQARAAFDQLSGEVHASARNVFVQDSHFLRDASIDRLRSAFDSVGASYAPVMSYAPGGPVLVPGKTDRFAVWGRAFGAWGTTAGDGNAARMRHDVGGAFIGADGLVGDNWRVGLLTGYSRSTFRVSDRSSSGASDNYHLGIYGGSQFGALAFRSGASLSWHDITTSRSVSFAGFTTNSLRGRQKARTAQVFGELGYGVRIGSLGFEPFANLAYVNLTTDGFTEFGGPAALNVRSNSTGVTFTTLGLRASQQFSLSSMDLTARGTIGWRHAFGDVTPISVSAFAGGTPFSVTGLPIAQNAAVVEAGLDLNLTPQATLGIFYGGQFGSRLIDQNIRGNFNWKF